MNEQALLFALGSSHGWGAQVAARLGLALSAHEERQFEDGEHKARPLSDVRQRDVYLLSSLYGDNERSVNDKLVALLFFISALKDAGAGCVTAVMPLLAYARKDRQTQSRDPVTTRYVARLLEAAGVDRVVTIDVHNLAAYQNAFRCETVHLEATGLFCDHFANTMGARPAAVVSPDAGGMKRAERFRLRLAQALGRPVTAAFAEKHRANNELTGDAFVGDVKDRVAIIIDDLIASGSTLARTARSCLDAGAREVHAVATHGLFVGSANSILGDHALTSIVVCDSVPTFRVSAANLRDKIVVLSCAELVAQAIALLHNGGSIEHLLGH